MSRTRVVVKGQQDKKASLAVAERARRFLLGSLDVHMDEQHPLQGIHRQPDGKAYFEIAGTSVEAVRQAAKADNLLDLVSIQQTDEILGEECANCGNIAGPLIPTVCPNCGFRDISPCPYDNAEISRQAYERIAGDLFRCPGNGLRVRLRFNDPLFKSDGSYNQPLVVVERAQEMKDV